MPKTSRGVLKFHGKNINFRLILRLRYCYYLLVVFSGGGIGRGVEEARRLHRRASR
jgi:hypothetical protein